MSYDLIAHLNRQLQFAKKTFGPGPRTEALCDHIAKELEEIKAKPDDVEEWIDVIILACEGAGRIEGVSSGDIVKVLKLKMDKNELRNWPDWRLSDPDKAIEHIK